MWPPGEHLFSVFWSPWGPGIVFCAAALIRVVGMRWRASPCSAVWRHGLGALGLVWGLWGLVWVFLGWFGGCGGGTPPIAIVALRGGDPPPSRFYTFYMFPEKVIPVHARGDRYCKRHEDAEEQTKPTNNKRRGQRSSALRMAAWDEWNE